MHTPFEPFVSVAEPTGAGLTIHSSTQSPSFVRAEVARLLGWPENRVRVKVPYIGGGFGAKVYVKMEALAAALALIARRPVKRGAVDGGAVLHHHQARLDHAHQECGRRRRAHHGARMRGVVERRRLCRHRPARDAEIGLHRRRPLRHRERFDRFLRALHQPAAGGRAARLRHSAARLGVREPHRHDRPQAGDRPDRVSAEEPAARRTGSRRPAW